MALSGSERVRRYRLRQRGLMPPWQPTGGTPGYIRTRQWREHKRATAEAAVAEERRRRAGIQPDGSWQAAFPGQRPPFQKGHHSRMTHGAGCAAVVDPRAAVYLAELLEAAPWLASPQTAADLEQFARACAQADLLVEWIDRQPPEPDGAPAWLRYIGDYGIYDRVVRKQERLSRQLGLDVNSPDDCPGRVAEQEWRGQDIGTRLERCAEAGRCLVERHLAELDGAACSATSDVGH